MADLIILQQALGILFKDPSLLDHALIHSSYVNENPDAAAISNERLEFLGDAVLGLVVAEKLYEDLPDCAEGELTRMRAVLVRKDTLARMAGSIGLGGYLYLGKGEEAGGGRCKPANLAGALEALIAAIYLDLGMATAKEFIQQLFGDELSGAVRQGVVVDSKSQLQELLQARGQSLPTYKLTQATGPDHAREFTVEVRVDDTVLGLGKGKTKKAAETAAARDALKRLSASFTQ